MEKRRGGREMRRREEGEGWRESETEWSRRGGK